LQAAVIEAAAAADARLVMADNLYMYGPTDGAPLTEDLPYRATSSKGKLRAQMAEELLAAHRAGKVQVAIGRASDYFGPHGLISHMGQRVFYRALAGKKAQVLGNPDVAHTYSYLPDVGRALVNLGEREEALGEVWHVPNPETLTTREFVGRVYQETGNQPGIQAMPRTLLAVLSWFNPTLKAIQEELYQLEEPFVIDHTSTRRRSVKVPLHWRRRSRQPCDGSRRTQRGSAR
jgi:nucleoside-diphosphate-sugar epimerase